MKHFLGSVHFIWVRTIYAARLVPSGPARSSEQPDPAKAISREGTALLQEEIVHHPGKGKA